MENEKLKSKQKKFGKNFSQVEKERIKRWINFLHDLLDSKSVSRIGILKHWYKGGLEDEEITIMKTEKITINQVTPDLFFNLYEDTLYEFFPIYDF